MGKLMLHPLLKGFQPMIRLLIKVEDRAHTDRNLHLILKVIADPVIGNQLVLGHINRIGLQVEAVLNRSVHPLWKGGYKPIPLSVFKDLRSVFGNEP